MAAVGGLLITRQEEMRMKRLILLSLALLVSMNLGVCLVELRERSVRR